MTQTHPDGRPDAVTIREYRRSDAEPVRRLLVPGDDPLFTGPPHSPHGPARDRPWSRTRIAVHGGTVTGAVTVTQGRLHAGRRTVAVAVHPAWRRRGIGRRLIDVADALGPGPVPARTPLACPVPEAVAPGFALAVGAVPYQRCPGVRPQPRSPGCRAWTTGQLPPPGHHVVALARLPRRTLDRAWIEQYTWTHERWSPVTCPATLTELAADIVTGADPIRSTAVCRGDHPVAVCWALPEPDGPITLVAETVRRHEPHGTAAVAAALAATLRRLASAPGRIAVEIDGHDTDPQLSAVLATLAPATPAAPYLLMERPCRRSG